jgi:hypothetical protein
MKPAAVKYKRDCIGDFRFEFRRNLVRAIAKRFDCRFDSLARIVRHVRVIVNDS